MPLIVDWIKLSADIGARLKRSSGGCKVVTAAMHCTAEEAKAGDDKS
jgi:hypothetical protein